MAARVKTFAHNRLVVIYPTANPAKIQSLADLARPGVKVDLAAKTVPVGQYALTFLDAAAADPSYGASYKTNVLKNVVSYETDVKSVLSKVALGEADAGIVYTTDAATETGKVGTVAIPDTLNTIALYPIGVVKASKQSATAQVSSTTFSRLTGRRRLPNTALSPGVMASNIARQARKSLPAIQRLMKQKSPTVYIEDTSPAGPGELLTRRRYAGAGLKGFVGRLALVLASLPLLIFFILPLLALVLRVPLSDPLAALSDPAVGQAIQLSLATTLVTLALTLVGGTPLALLLARRRFPGPRCAGDADRSAGGAATCRRWHRPAGGVWPFRTAGRRA